MNHYSDKGSRKFSRRYRGPFVVDSRRGVNYKILGGLRGPKWVHHDELRPWFERSVPQKAPSISGEPEAVRRELDVGDSESSSEDEAVGEDEAMGEDEAVVEDEAVGERVSRAARRRPPGWLRDYYVF